jgi:hypothetical protein
MRATFMEAYAGESRMLSMGVGSLNLLPTNMRLSPMTFARSLHRSMEDRKEEVIFASLLFSEGPWRSRAEAHFSPNLCNPI